MHDRRLQFRGEFVDLRRPVRQQRCRRHQQARLVPRIAIVPALREQQRQNLDRLAEPHVVGQACPEPQPGQQMQPLHTGLLIRPQYAMQRRAGIAARTVRCAKFLQRFRQPRSCRNVRPVGGGHLRRIVRDRRTRQHPHRLGERQTIARGQFLGLAELPHRTLEPFAIDLDPLTAQQHQGVGAGKQRRDFPLAERLPVQRDVHAEIQQPIEADGRWRACADRPGHLRARRTAGPPRRRACARRRRHSPGQARWPAGARLPAASSAADERSHRHR